MRICKLWFNLGFIAWTVHPLYYELLIIVMVWNIRIGKDIFFYLGIVTHLVYEFCVEIAFSSSSSALDFFNFFTRLFTAFSDHFPSIDESSLPFFHANRRFTIGGVNGNIFESNKFLFTIQALLFFLMKVQRKTVTFFRTFRLDGVRLFRFSQLV